jgi:hypothetical protein
MGDKAIQLKILIEKVKEKTGAKDYSMKGFEDMSLALDEAGYKFDAKYLRYNLYKGGKSIRLSKLDSLAEYLGYKNYNSFVDSLSIDPILQSMEGHYYCYVRMNQAKGEVLRSPVKISIKNGQVLYHQKGGRLEYQGEMKKHGGCLFVLMRSIDGTKSFYHIYKIGMRPAPIVLQGIFSGVSSAFEPIGGRAILWRSDKSFDSLKTGKLEIRTMQKSKQKAEQQLAAYFQYRESNNLSIKSAYTFGSGDLE